MVTLIERHLHGTFSLRLPRLATTRRGNFVSGRDGLIYIKGTIGTRGLIRLYGARYVFYNRIGYVAGRPDRMLKVFLCLFTDGSDFYTWSIRYCLGAEIRSNCRLMIQT